MTEPRCGPDPVPSTTELPGLPVMPLGRPLRVMVLTCSDQGWEVVEALRGSRSVELLAVVRSPERRPASYRKRLANVFRYHGVAGVLRIPRNKVAAALRGRMNTLADARTRGVPLYWFRDFHDPECLAAVRAMEPDLAIVDGTSILKPAIFALPRFGSVNIHCGWLPDYRGAPPAFWELLNGETSVGVTIHRVTSNLDEGPILARDSVALDPAPPGDPMDYVRELWLQVLRPRALLLLRGVVEAIAEGQASGEPQGPSRLGTFRRPDRHKVRELRRVVSARRRSS